MTVMMMTMTMIVMMTMTMIVTTMIVMMTMMIIVTTVIDDDGGDSDSRDKDGETEMVFGPPRFLLYGRVWVIAKGGQHKGRKGEGGERWERRRKRGKE